MLAFGLTEGDKDADADEDDDPAGGNVEHEGEHDLGWPNPPFSQRLLGDGSEGEPSLGSLSGMMNQERWAEQGGLPNGWPANYDAEQEHDGREPGVDGERDDDDMGAEDFNNII